MTFTDTQKRDSLKREIAMRKRVYPRFVASGRFTQEKADREIAIMVAILDDYAEPDLFGGDDTPTVGRAGPGKGRPVRSRSPRSIQDSGPAPKSK